MQERRKSIANVLELRRSYTNPSMCAFSSEMETCSGNHLVKTKQMVHMLSDVFTMMFQFSWKYITSMYSKLV